MQSASVKYVDTVEKEGSEVTPSHDDTNLTHFEDLNSGITSSPPEVAMTQTGKHKEAELGEWFKRPIKIETFTWAETQQLAHSFDPFKAYFSKPLISAKLSGYTRMRCTLVLKFVVNATPFQYGLAYAAYKPLSVPALIGNLFQSELADHSGGVLGFGDGDARFIPLSTRNHIEILPQVNQGGELVIPFCFYSNWYELNENTFSQVATGFGKVDLISLSELRSCAPAGSTDCNISVFAWCQDIELSGPGFMVLQSGKASQHLFGLGGLAETVGNAIPYVKPYTSIVGGVANAAGSVARLLGHTPNLGGGSMPANQMVDNPGVAEADDGLTVHHFQMTSQNKLPMDPTDTGFPMVDEMTYSYMLSKPVFCTYSDWNSAQQTDATLMRINVSPEVFVKVKNSGATASYYSVDQSLSSYLAMMHKYWRGEITYRFQVIASQYHRGRIRVSFDPRPGTANADGFQISKVIDLNETTQCELEIPWFASPYWLQCAHQAMDPHSHHQPFDSTMHNQLGGVGSSFYAGTTLTSLGTITVSVLNELRSPETTADVMVAVYADMSKLQFAYPMLDKITQDYAMSNVQDLYDLQSGESNHYFGEALDSARTLAQRTSEYFAYRPNYQTNFSDLVQICPRIPAGRGPIVSSINTLVPTVSNGNFTRGAVTVPSYINQHTFAALVYSCYVGQRGSYVWRLEKTPIAPSLAQAEAYMGRTDTNPFSATYQAFFHSFEENPMWSRLLFGGTTSVSCSDGYIKSKIQSYIPYKFQSCNPLWTYNFRSDYFPLMNLQDNVMFRLGGPIRVNGGTGINGATVRIMVGAGDDWTCFGLQNAPTLYVADATTGGAAIQTRVTRLGP